MLIAPGISPETAARDLRNSRAAEALPRRPAPPPTARPPIPPLGRLQGLVALDEDGVSAITDAAGADQVTEFLRADLLSPDGSALAAQANVNPESAYSLLQ